MKAFIFGILTGGPSIAFGLFVFRKILPDAKRAKFYQKIGLKGSTLGNSKLGKVWEKHIEDPILDELEFAVNNIKIGANSDDKSPAEKK